MAGIRTLRPHACRKFSEACERNKDPILQVLKACFADRSQVLEIGSGSGQHAFTLRRSAAADVAAD